MEEFKEQYSFYYSNTKGTNVTVELENGDLTEVIEKFSDFLRGCGFCFNGELDIVLDEEEEKKDNYLISDPKIKNTTMDELVNKAVKKIYENLKNGKLKIEMHNVGKGEEK